MDRRRLTALPILLVLLAQAAWAQRPLSRDEAMEILAAGGRWIELEGELQADGTFITKEVDIIAAADTANMVEIQISGPVSNINRRFSKLTVLGYTVTWNEETKIRDAEKHQVLSNKLKDGQGVKVKGKLQDDGTFKARRISLTKGKARDDGSMRYKQEMTGPAVVVDADQGWLRILKTDIKLRQDCKFVENAVEVEEDEDEKT